MSDEEFMFDDGDDGDYDFEYEENSDSGELSLETKYYNAKTQREDDLSVALSEFAEVVSEDEKEGSSEWGFKATKQTLKIQLKQSADGQATQQQIFETYDRMLAYISKSIVARNYAEKSINSMLERVSLGMDPAFTREFYEKTLVVLKQTRNDRLWLRTSLRLGKLLLDQRDFKKLASLLDELKRSCLDDAGNVILERGTQMLEVNAMLLGMYVELEDARKLKDVYLESVGVRSAIPHPRIMGFIRECGGKMYMAERNWENAQANFFDAFKNYDEAGSPQRVQMLKYLVLASMLSESEVNPLSSPEARSYEADPEIIAMTKLVRAYEKQQVNDFERVLEDHSDAILGDRFIARFVDDLRRTFRMLTLQSIVAPYTRVRISSLAHRLRIDVAEAEELLIALILDKRLRASIDQENSILLLQQETTDESQYDAVSNWTSGLESMMKQALTILS
ncbi:hypothetical protein GGI15_001827 [Coemansia interrupta]|uniref:PCI domain-containing protein n=1 Tax=Coemansia interrupta TaxID=1126814 RepID=A0A9W8HJZ9_9FUNG|nr:hypothetical protein GGI15_001827 [Coemansia interrupta]